jgi:hypothetical protein
MIPSFLLEPGEQIKVGRGPNQGAISLPAVLPPLHSGISLVFPGVPVHPDNGKKNSPEISRWE